MAQTAAQNLILRPAIADDVDWAVPLLFSVCPALFSYIFATPSDQAQEILRQAFIYPSHAFSYEHTQVIQVEEVPVALMIAYPGSLKKQADEKMHLVMARLIPLRKLPKILVNVADFNRIKQDVTVRDFYILGISVVPELRNLGLGTYLLSQAERQAQQHHCATVCLDVTYTNSFAQRWFERSGYQTICSKTTDRFEQTTRAGGIHRMFKSLNPR